ncbi:hypothetical protein [Cryptosporangium aurantiacum]|uniref:hypothetical protein n=1 Tax=Cryptosporangium aurantiacum TaxID=134849 RepID=UPI0011610E78|nr:hypothetical protein [Cryptosporangium aurantiacum]
MIGIVLLTLIFVLWAVTTGAIRFLGSDDDEPGPNSTTAQPSVGSTTAVTDGDLEMKLRSIRPAGPGKLAVTLVVRNRTSAYVSFFSESQKLVSADEHGVNGAVGLTPLEPQETATVTVVFTLPDGFVADELELHAAPASPGVRVPLS